MGAESMHLYLTGNGNTVVVADADTGKVYEADSFASQRLLEIWQNGKASGGEQMIPENFRGTIENPNSMIMLDRAFSLDHPSTRARHIAESIVEHELTPEQIQNVLDAYKSFYGEELEGIKPSAASILAGWLYTAAVFADPNPVVSQQVSVQELAEATISAETELKAYRYVDGHYKGSGLAEAMAEVTNGLTVADAGQALLERVLLGGPLSTGAMPDVIDSFRLKLSHAVGDMSVLCTFDLDKRAVTVNHPRLIDAAARQVLWKDMRGEIDARHMKSAETQPCPV